VPENKGKIVLIDLLEALVKKDPCKIIFSQTPPLNTEKVGFSFGPAGLYS
jgi:hypothetical protein